MRTLTSLVFVIAIGSINSEENKPCITPNGESATCVPASSCKVIYEAFLTKRKDAVEFAKKSQCPNEKEKLLCCGSTGFPTTTTTTTTTEPPIDEDFLALFASPASTSPPPEPLLDLDTNELPDRSICGIVKEEDRIFGGETTKLKEFPWMAALEYKKKRTGEKVGIKCGGSVINTKFILTAAHCVNNADFELIGVRLGEWNITTDPDCPSLDEISSECADPVQNFTIKESIPHRFYNSETHENDIALLRLNEEITYTDYIRPICLPPLNLPSLQLDAKLTVTGWGLTENTTEEPSAVKLKVELPVKANNLCKEVLKETVSSNQLCAGGEPGKDACQGDSGGPLMRIFEDPAKGTSNWYLEGVVSYGLKCGKTGYPAIYTRLTRFLNWIVNIISEEF